MLAGHVDEHAAAAQPGDARQVDDADEQQAEGEGALAEEPASVRTGLSHGDGATQARSQYFVRRRVSSFIHTKNALMRTK